MKYYYKVAIKHDGLGKFEVVKGETQYEAQQKANAKMQQWNKMYDRELKREKREQEKIERQEFIEEQINKAEDETEAAKLKIINIKDYLKDSLKKKPITSNILKNKAKFTKVKPVKKLPHDEKEIENKPVLDDFIPKIGLIDKMIKSRIAKKNEIAKEQLSEATKEYNKKVKENKKAEKKFSKELAKWKKSKKEFYRKIDEDKSKYESGDATATSKFFNLVLSISSYPKDFKKDFTLNFNSENKILIIDFKLPELKDMPRVEEVKFIKLKKILKKSYISDSKLKENYDNFLYQTSLKIINDIYKSDYSNVVESVVFNGWIETIDRKTGKDVTLCILSIQASREQFLSLNLERINPKECFKGLKGVSSVKLHTVTPVAPILQINKEDRRFISSYEVMKNIDDSQNIAAMNWEDFEHLIREIFEKEFTIDGGEVRVTQSSRDGGVDAVAFDPDPIRGGKIVIQAKRYTNVVSVSAVRDLYGTVIKEGAIKGILVTTADYGADAYDFAKDKPLTLLNGSNLLHLLERHGHKAKIDLKEAKLILEEQKK